MDRSSVTVYFVSDGSVEHRGFSASVSAGACSAGPSPKPRDGATESWNWWDDLETDGPNYDGVHHSTPTPRSNYIDLPLEDNAREGV